MIPDSGQLIIKNSSSQSFALVRVHPSPLVELQFVFLSVVDEKKRSCSIVVLREPDHSRMLRQVHVNDDTSELEHGEGNYNCIIPHAFQSVCV